MESEEPESLRGAHAFADGVLTFLVRVVLSVLLLGLVAAMGRLLWSIGSTLLGGGSMRALLRIVIVDALSLLAVLEVYKTTRTYFVVGRVRVTYAIDTVWSSSSRNCWQRASRVGPRRRCSRLWLLCWC